MSEIDTQPFPRGALIAAGAVVGLSIVGTALVRLERLTTPQPPVAALSGAPEASVDLRFADESDGSVTVTDSRTGLRLGTLPAGSDGFIRGVVRGLAHDRLTRHIGSEPPFRLTRRHHSDLYLQDTATGRLIDLQAFGSTNREAFGRFLPPSGGAS